MTAKNQLKHCLAFCAILVGTNVTAAGAQTVETVGSRALGMGGAFVAVATDSSATWWNPAALAAGPFLDSALGRALVETRGDLPAHRDTTTWFAIATPPVGFSYYRLRITDIEPFGDSTVTESGSRQIETVSLAASQFGVSLVQTLTQGVHVGATLKYLRGSVQWERELSALAPEALLDRGDELEASGSDGAFGLDAGVLGVAGALRVGLLVRNAVEAEFESDAALDGVVSETTSVRLERHFRVGIAYDGRAIGRPPLVIAVDADVSTVTGATGDRRNVALGAEQWLMKDRLGVRGGARFNTVGDKERVATGGVSVALRAGLFLDAHVVGGGREDDRGWGVGARVSF